MFWQFIVSAADAVTYIFCHGTYNLLSGVDIIEPIGNIALICSVMYTLR